MKKYFFLSIFTTLFFINNAFAQFERGYADLVERLLPSVVSIATSQIVERRTSSIPELPERHPFNDMFEDFFGNQNSVAEFVEEFKLTNKDIDEKHALIKNEKEFQLFDLSDYKTQLKAKEIPFEIQSGEHKTIEIEIKNQSNTHWLPTKKSGLKLMAGWYDATYNLLEKNEISLNEVLYPGENTTIKLEITAPKNTSKITQFIGLTF